MKTDARRRPIRVCRRALQSGFLLLLILGHRNPAPAAPQGRNNPLVEGILGAVYGFHGEANSRQIRELFKLEDKPTHVVVTGTPWAATPAPPAFFPRRAETIGNLLDALVFYGIVPDVVISASRTELESKYGAELDRCRRLLDEARELQRRGMQPVSPDPPDAVKILGAHLSHGVGGSPLDSELVHDPVMAKLVVAARRAIKEDELRRRVPQADPLEERLQALEQAGLVRRQSGEVQATFPILFGKEKEEYDRLLFAAADRIDAELRTKVRALLAELQRRNWEEWSYYFVWSGVFDSQFLWAEVIKRNLAPPLFPSIAWVVYPSHEFKSGTNYYPDDELLDQFLPVAWTPRGGPTLERVGQAWRMVLPAAMAGTPAGPEEARRLNELGLLDDGGRVRVPVVRNDDPLYGQLRLLAHAYIEVLVQHMPIQETVALVGFPRDHVWAMAYHDLSWELLRRMTTDGLLKRPEALQPGDAARVASMAGTCAVVDVYPPFRKLIESAIAGADKQP